MQVGLYPLDFLQKQAIVNGLTQSESLVFQLVYGSDRLSRQKVQRVLNISAAHLQKRMGRIYAKFGINGKHRGKFETLDRQLLKLFIEETDKSHEVAELALNTEVALNIDIDVNTTAPADKVAAELATFCKALNSCHIAYGGNGLEIDDWETLIAVRELAGI